MDARRCKTYKSEEKKTVASLKIREYSGVGVCGSTFWIIKSCSTLRNMVAING